MPRLRSAIRAFRIMFVDYVCLPLIRVLKHPFVRSLVRLLLQQKAHELLTA